MRIGYARICIFDQGGNRQHDALTAAGCEQVFTDEGRGSKTDQRELQNALACATKGDTLVAWKLDRIRRSVHHLIETINYLRERGIELICLQEKIDTTNSAGQVFFHIIASLAEFERDLIIERTSFGLATARARRRKGGRRSKLTTQDIAQARVLLDSGDASKADLMRIYGVSRRTLDRYLTENPLQTATIKL